jgi:D-alanyl-D-alanine carboxypeptidase (penicillin-binding protein 5/6)
MTLYLAFEDLEAGRISWDETVTVSARATRTPRYRMGLRAGEKVPFRLLLEGVAIASANDAATALAEHLAGDEDGFVARMNAAAERIGLTQTRFANPHGLPDANQRSTARDMAVLTEHLLQDYPESRAILGGKSFIYRGKVYSRQIPLFRQPGGVQALKTGFTNEAGYNLAVASWRNGQRLLCIVLGAQSRNLSFLDAQKLFQYGFARMGLDWPEEERRPPAKKRARARLSLPDRRPSESGPGGFR